MEVIFSYRWGVSWLAMCTYERCKAGGGLWSTAQILAVHIDLPKGKDESVAENTAHVDVNRFHHSTCGA